MAITKISRIENLQGFLIYASNPAKTQDGSLIYEHRCSLPFAVSEFNKIVAVRKRKNGKAFNEQPWAITQAFKPHEIDPEDANRLGREFAEKYLGKGHQFIVMTHDDGDHIHNHIVFNHVDMDSLKCFDSKTGNIIKNLRKASDTLCREKNLSIVENPKRGGFTQKEFYARKQNRSYKARIERLMDAAVEKSKSYEEFLGIIRNDVEVSTDGIMKFKFPEQERWTRITKLRPDYSEDSLRFRIENKELAAAIGKKAKTEKFGKLGSGAAALDRLYRDIRIIDDEIFMLERNIAHIEVFRNSWQLIQDFKKAEDKAEFKSQHFLEFKAYDEAKKAVSELRGDDGKLPKADGMKKRARDLHEKKKPLATALEMAEKSMPNMKNLNAKIDKRKFRNYSDRYDVFYNSGDTMDAISALLRQGLLMRRHNIDTEEYKELEKAGKAHLDELENTSRALQREITSLEKYMEQEPIYRASRDLMREYRNTGDKKGFKRQHYEKFKAYDVAKRTVFRFRDDDGGLPEPGLISAKIDKLKAERRAINSNCKEFRENLKSTGFVGIGMRQRGLE